MDTTTCMKHNLLMIREPSSGLWFCNSCCQEVRNEHFSTYPCGGNCFCCKKTPISATVKICDNKVTMQDLVTTKTCLNIVCFKCNWLTKCSCCAQRYNRETGRGH